MTQLAEAVHDADEAVDDAQEPIVGAEDAPDGPDEEAMMARFLGLMDEDKAAHDAEDGTPAAPPAADAAGDDVPLTPAQQAVLDKKLKAADADYTRKTQAVAEQRREVEERERRLAAREAALEVAREERSATAPTTGRTLTIQDCLDPDTGELLLDKFAMYQDQRDAALEARITGTHIKPVAEELTARKQQEADRTMLAEEQRLRTEFETAKKAFPHLADDEDVQRNVVQHMAQNGIRSFRAAYADLYPAQFAAAVQLYQQAVARKKQSGGQEPPAMPPGRRDKAQDTVPTPEDREAFEDAMVREAGRLMGTR